MRFRKLCEYQSEQSLAFRFRKLGIFIGAESRTTFCFHDEGAQTQESEFPPGPVGGGDVNATPRKAFA